VEVVLAPAYADDALKAFGKKTNVRVLEIPCRDAELGDAHPGNDVRRVGSGLLIQTADRGMVTANDLKIVTHRAPTGRE
jgi:phosphoribosylaminoimidazolecarboxamide formyltransferase/IMP cyclohydrolase